VGKFPEIPEIPDIPNPDGRTWHPLTVARWTRALQSPMAGQWLDADIDGLGALALLWDLINTNPCDTKLSVWMGEERLQAQRFGLSPLDRSRLQWEIRRASEEPARKPSSAAKRGSSDPRRLLMAVK